MEGIKAKNIEIYSSRISISSNKDSISANEDIIINGASLEIMAGSSKEKSLPFKIGGQLKIDNAYIMSLGTNCIEGGNILTNQYTFYFYGKINPVQEIIIKNEGEILYEFNADEEN